MIVVFTHTNPTSIGETEVFRAGTTAVVAGSASRGWRNTVRW